MKNLKKIFEIKLLNKANIKKEETISKIEINSKNVVEIETETKPTKKTRKSKKMKMKIH